jgi:hypothetical protein
MALFVIASAKGAPGVTTLTVALAALSRGRAVAADLDPDPDVGLLSLAAALRRDPADPRLGRGVTGLRGTGLGGTGLRGTAGMGGIGASGGAGGVAEHELPTPAQVDDHLQVTDGGLEVLLGVDGPDQAIGLGPLWSPLARALTEVGRPVFADCGRVGPASAAMPVLMQADAVLMVARAELEELAHLRERLRFLIATLPGRYTGRARIGVILLARERDRAAGPRTEQLLRASGVAVPVLGVVADDPSGAARLRGEGNGRAGRTTLIRSVRSLLPAVGELAGLGSSAADLNPARSDQHRIDTGQTQSRRSIDPQDQADPQHHPGPQHQAEPEHQAEPHQQSAPQHRTERPGAQPENGGGSLGGVDATLLQNWNR